MGYKTAIESCKPFEIMSFRAYVKSPLVEPVKTKTPPAATNWVHLNSICSVIQHSYSQYLPPFVISTKHTPKLFRALNRS